MKYFLLYWSNEGFEHISDVTEDHPDNFEATVAMARICGEPDPVNPTNQLVFSLRMRAQYNPQRHYECYVIGAQDLELDDIQDFANTDPQGLVNFAREKHYYKVFDLNAPTRRANEIV